MLRDGSLEPFVQQILRDIGAYDTLLVEEARDDGKITSKFFSYSPVNRDAIPTVTSRYGGAVKIDVDKPENLWLNKYNSDDGEYVTITLYKRLLI
jgi:predicted SpoU family rRNA methylase